MKFSEVHIEGLGVIDAPIRVESEMLEMGFQDTLRRLGSKPGLIRSLTGVVARRFFEDGVQPSWAATEAARRAIHDAQIPAGAIGLIISTSVSKDYIEPSIASSVHGNLGLSPSCLNFDVGNACLAFLNAMEVASMMIEARQIQYALIVAGESSRLPVESTVRLLSAPTTTQQDLRDHFATLTLGSGGVAMVLSHRDIARKPHRFLGGVSRAATHQNHLCRGQKDHMITDARGLLDAGVELARQTFEAARTEMGWSREVLDALMMHQVGSVHFDTILRTVGLDVEKALVTYAEYGNMGPASIPTTLAKAVEQGRVKSGDRIALMGIGSGLNCAMMEAVW